MAPRLKQSEAIAVVGSALQLGEWDEAKAVRMKLVGVCQWAVPINASLLMTPFEYKYVVIDKKSGRILRWESGRNRVVNYIPDEKPVVIAIDDATPDFAIPVWRGAGIVIPVFSLRSEQSQGVGDFGDLRRLVDWTASVGMSAIQILPINDTTINNTWTDSYPYNSISIFALHPMYADLCQLPKLANCQKQSRYERKWRELNVLAKVDYEAVNKVKRGFLHEIYDQEGDAVIESSEFLDFFRGNAYWLVPYAAYSYLRDKYGTADFRLWPKYSHYDRDHIAALCAKGGEAYHDVAFYYYVQFVLHTQLTATSQYARQKGVIIKGDIPIGISRNGVETWTEPHYFNLNGQTGAPPDPFSTNGQNWGFPTYNWDVMERDGYRWWMRRFTKMAEYFDAYRIDHILGFFRIWEIPAHSVHGLLGQFSPSLPMSQSEIESYGLTFDRSRMTRPLITDRILDSMFGESAGEIKDKYLNHRENGIYDMKPEYDTQRKVEAAFSGRTDERSEWIRDGLYSLISNVLFVVDRKDSDMFHPRISAQLDFAYEALGDADKEAFNRLYEDYFYHRHNKFWYEQAMKKLPALTNATRLLVCGEDLGMVPESVPWVMNELHLLSLEIQSMPKSPHRPFSNLWENPYLSVSTIST
ncbi:MAG: 4-alpha-glucanotransferase, partial [Paludibacteraceae bacterium]|nr:4-alpha-glucanotransferase [Paludibacteraceae bacterium]